MPPKKDSPDRGTKPGDVVSYVLPGEDKREIRPATVLEIDDDNVASLELKNEERTVVTRSPHFPEEGLKKKWRGHTWHVPKK